MRKIRYLGIALMLNSLGIVIATAQEAVNIDKINGSVVSTELDKLQKIMFSADETTMTILSLDGTTVNVDLNDITKITFGEYQIISDAISTPQNTEFSIIANDALRISCPDGIKHVAVYDVTGKMLYEDKVDAYEFNLSLSTLCKCVCIVKVQTGTAVVTQKLIIK